MKKLLSVVCFVVAVGVGAAQAADRSGKLGLGWQEAFTSSTGSSLGTTAGSWSLKYGVSSNLTGQFVVGFDIINKGGNNAANFGGRLLYDLVENENSDFYTGLGLVFELDKTAAGNLNMLRINIPLGFEWSFAGLPEVGLSAEAGIVWDYGTSGAKQSRFSSVGGTAGGALGLGAHYYF